MNGPNKYTSDHKLLQNVGFHIQKPSTNLQNYFLFLNEEDNERVV
uniref:Uncharacterized protein n=1 Tax=Rhizophora mucronata TaxID=61149 RepID=A0A2P2PCX3_RHIMU